MIHIRSTRRAWHGVLVVAALLVLSLVGVAPSQAAPATEHCTDHKTETKVQAEDSPATVSVLDTTTGDMIDVIVTITGTDFTIEPVDPSVTLTDASWCVKSSTKATNGSGTSGQSGSFNKKGVRQAISYVVIYSVTSQDQTTQPCDSATASGGEGVTTTAHELGTSGPTSFLFEWEAYGVPDRFQVYYEGALIHDTGSVGDDINEGTGSATVNVPAGSSSQVTVVVTGPFGTAWDYVVNCPTPSSSS